MVEETFGGALRRLRGRRSLRDVTRLANVSPSYLSDLERGNQLPSIKIAQHLDTKLGGSGKLVGLARAERAQAEQDRAEAVAAQVMTGGLAASLLFRHSDQEAWDMRRRSLITGIGGLAGLGVAGPALGLEMVRHGLLDALRRRSGDAGIEEWPTIIDEYGYTYMTTRPAQLLDQLRIDLLALQYAISSTTDDAHMRRLQSTGALLAALTAMTLGNLSQVNAAARWWRSARTAADESGDSFTILSVRGREIMRALFEQRPLAQITDLADQALAIAEAHPDTVRPELLAGHAQLLALLGRSQEATTSLGRFEDHLAGVPAVATDGRESLYAWPEVRLRYAESFVYAHLGDLAHAGTAQDRAMTLYPASYPRGPAQIELMRAFGLVRTGDAPAGVDHAHTTITTLPAGQQIRPIANLAEQVLDAIPASERTRPYALEYRDLIAAFNSAQVHPSA